MDSQSVNQVNLLSGDGDLKAKAPSGIKATPDSDVVGTVNFPSKFRGNVSIYTIIIENILHMFNDISSLAFVTKKRRSNNFYYTNFIIIVSRHQKFNSMFL